MVCQSGMLTQIAQFPCHRFSCFSLQNTATQRKWTPFGLSMTPGDRPRLSHTTSPAAATPTHRLLMKPKAASGPCGPTSDILACPAYTKPSEAYRPTSSDTLWPSPSLPLPSGLLLPSSPPEPSAPDGFVPGFVLPPWPAGLSRMLGTTSWAPSGSEAVGGTRARARPRKCQDTCVDWSGA